MSKKRKGKSLTQLLWTLASLDYMDELAKSYAYGGSRSRTRTTFSLAGFLLLAGAATWATVYGDIIPSYRWVRDVAEAVAPGQDLTRQSIVILLFALSIVPNALEFASVEVAVRGSIPVKVAIYVSVVFDLLTDGPTAYAWSHAMVASAISGYPGMPGWLIPPLEILLGIPLLLLFSLGLEILALTFILTAWRLLLTYFSISTVRRAERAARGGTRRPPKARTRRPARAAPTGAYRHAMPPDFYAEDETSPGFGGNDVTATTF